MAIAIFDFDGTIFSRDSLADFLMQTCGKRRFFLYLPLVIGLKLATISGMLSTHCAKEKVFTLFLHGMKWQDFLQACLRYANRIPRFIYPAALEQIKQHLIAGDRVAIISASVADWIRPWAESVGIQYVEGTTLEVKNGILTGKLAGPNCKGMEKVRRLRQLFPDFESDTLYVYGDSTGDKEILALATYPHYKTFKKLVFLV